MLRTARAVAIAVLSVIAVLVAAVLSARRSRERVVDRFVEDADRPLAQIRGGAVGNDRWADAVRALVAGGPSGGPSGGPQPQEADECPGPWFSLPAGRAEVYLDAVAAELSLGLGATWRPTLYRVEAAPSSPSPSCLRVTACFQAGAGTEGRCARLTGSVAADGTTSTTAAEPVDGSLPEQGMFLRTPADDAGGGFVPVATAGGDDAYSYEARAPAPGPWTRRGG